MSLMKSRQITSGRYPIAKGIDFSMIERQRFSTAGTTIKFYGGTTMGYNYTSGEWTNGIKVVTTLTAGTLVGGTYKGKYSMAFQIEATTTSIYDGHQNGVLNVDFEREAAYGHSGGSPDCGIRCTALNYATCASGGVRGMDIMAYGRGTQGNVHGALITARTRGSSAGGAGTVYGARIVAKNGAGVGGFAHQHALEVACESDGVQPASNSIVYIEKHSNSYTAATRAGIEIVNNCNASYPKAITYGIYLKSGTSGCKFTYFAGFDSNNGDESFTAVSGATQGGNIDGYITVYDVATGQALYINCHDAAPA